MRPIRNTDPSLFRLISTRTCEARLWMIPTRKIEKMIGGIIARYQEAFDIEIYAYCFLTNHYHLLIRAPRGNADEFIENVNREIARRMNFKLKRSGKFWSRRYDDLTVGDNDEDRLRAFLYVNTNPTKHGVARDSRKWLGLNSYNHSLNERDRTFTFYHYSAEDDAPKSTKHCLKLSPLPQLKDRTQEERRLFLEEKLREHGDTLIKEGEAEGKGFSTEEQILSQEPGEKPKNVSKSNRPHCYTGDVETWIATKKAERKRRYEYKEASFEYRLGNKRVNFPEFSFLPPLHRAPRFVPFKPLERDLSLIFA